MTAKITQLVRRPLAAAVLVGLLAPGAAFAQSETAKEKQLEARVEQLEAQVQALLNSQQQQQSQISTTQSQVANTQAQLDKVQVAAPATPAAPAAKPQFTTAPGVSIGFHGFINATAFEQDYSNFGFGNGQNAEWPTPVPGTKNNISGVDVRNTRFWFDITGAQLSDNWTGSGRIEMDFFGGYNGTGGYSSSQPVPRLRQAYMDVVNASTGTTFRIGQQWSLMFPIDNVTDSVTHVAFPLGFGTGMIGWRFPGVVWMQDLNHGSDGVKWRFDLGAYNNNWNNDATINFKSSGNAGFNPQVEARLRAQGTDWVAYLVGHYADIDLRGVDQNAATPIEDSFKSTGYEIGANWKPGKWNLRGQVYTGKGLGNIFGDMAQFGDIQETGGFAQVGYSFTKRWSASLFYAQVKPDRDDELAWHVPTAASPALMQNKQSALDIFYTLGAVKFGLEAMHDELDSTADGVATNTTKGNEYSVSAQYNF